MGGSIFSRYQRGATVAEFAVVALVFFMVIIGIIEFGRLLYTHNALADAARRGARYAVLHEENAPCLQEVVVYGEKHIDPGTCAPTGPALINGLTTANVIVVYQGTAPNAYGMNLGTATVTIENFTFDLGIPLFKKTLAMPKYSTTLTAESAGNDPPDI